MTRAPLIEGVRDLTEIGRGGFGVVYRGTEVEFGREVAVKVLMTLQDDRAKRRFDRERRAMGAVSDHENIVTVYRGGVTPGFQPYLVMEYVRGGSLSDRLNDVGPLDWRDAAIVGAKLADALTVAHRAGILHRDVKPGNVFVTEHGEPKLGDFGIAVLDDGQASRTAGITASVAHAPPEIVDGQPGDERSDLYSLASTIYALTNGAAPFSRHTDEGLSALLSRLATEAPRPLHLESAASGFEAAILKGLSKRPEDRQATVAEFGNELRRAALSTADIPQPDVPLATEPARRAVPPGSVQATPTPLPEPSQPHDTPQRAVSGGQLAFLGLLLLAIAAFGGWAVSKAVFGGTTTQVAETVTRVTPDPNPTAAELSPTTVPTAVAVPTATPGPAPTAVATPQPTAAPEPEPTAESGGGARGSALIPAGYVRVEDNSRAIRVDVPAAWAELRYDITDAATGRAEVSGRGIAIGGTVEQPGGPINLTAVNDPGLYIFAQRVAGEVDGDQLLDENLRDFSECAMGDRSQILLNNGNAHFQILECDRTDGEGTTGVIVYAMAHRDDPSLGISISLQLTDKAEIDQITEILPTINIEASRIPAPGEFEIEA